VLDFSILVAKLRGDEAWDFNLDHYTHPEKMFPAPLVLRRSCRWIKPGVSTPGPSGGKRKSAPKVCGGVH